jgi:hypothetical protein
MGGLRRLIIFVLLTAGAIMFRPVWMDSIRPHIPPEVAAGQAPASDELARKLQIFHSWQTLSLVLTVVVILGGAWILLPRPTPRDKERWPYVAIVGALIAFACGF